MTSSAPQPTKVTAVILTGGRDGHQELLEGTGISCKALLPVGGKPMVQSVIDAASASKYQPDILLSTSDPTIDILAKHKHLGVINNANTAARSFLSALNQVPGEDGYVLFISADHPLLTTEMIDYFIDEALKQGADITAGMVPRSLIQKEYPDSKRSYLKLKGDGYSGANLYLVNQAKFEGEASILEELDQHRKQKWKPIVKHLMTKPWLLLLFALRQLDIHRVVLLAEPFLQCKCGVVVMPWAEASMDVDKTSDRIIAEAILAKRKEVEPALPAGDKPPKLAVVGH